MHSFIGSIFIYISSYSHFHLHTDKMDDTFTSDNGSVSAALLGTVASVKERAMNETIGLKLKRLDRGDEGLISPCYCWLYNR
jgi:hypothetical protein